MNARRRTEKFQDDIEALRESKARKPELNTIVEEKEYHASDQTGFDFGLPQNQPDWNREVYTVPQKRCKVSRQVHIQRPPLARKQGCFDVLPCRRRKLFHLPMPAGTYNFYPFYEDTQGPGLELADGRFIPLQKPPTMAEEELSKAYAFVQDQIRQVKAGIDSCLSCIESSKSINVDHEYEEKLLSDDQSTLSHSSSRSSLQNEHISDGKQIDELDAAIDEMLRDRPKN